MRHFRCQDCGEDFGSDRTAPTCPNEWRHAAIKAARTKARHARTRQTREAIYGTTARLGEVLPSEMPKR